MFIQVLTKDGSLITADQAQNGIDYCCPHCGARMRVRKCTRKRSHFCLYDSAHTSDDCRIIEREKNIYRDVSLLDTEKFSKALNQSSTAKNGSKGGGRRVSTGDKALPPHGLRHLVGCGANKMDPNTPIKGGKLSDLLITSKSYHRFLSAESAIGFRVFELWLRGVFNFQFRYVANWNYKGTAYCAFFNHVPAAKLALELADRYFHDVKETVRGTPYWVNGTYKSVLVAGRWTYLDRRNCCKICNQCRNGVTNDGRLCQGMWIADMPNEQHIYGSGHPNNRK